MAIIPTGTDQEKALKLREQLNNANKPQQQTNQFQDKINSMYDSQFKAQQSALESAKQNALAQKQQQMQEKLPQFHNQRVGVDTDSALQMRKQNEMMASQGIRGGDNITATARNNTNRANQIQAIQQSENDYVKDMENQMANIERDYAMQIAQAQYQGDFNKANALLQQMGKEDDRNYQKEYEQSIWDRNNAYNQSQKDDDRKYEETIWDRNNKYNETQTQGDRNWQKEFWQTQANWDKQQQLEQWQRQVAENQRQEGVASARNSYSSGGGTSYSAPGKATSLLEIQNALENGQGLSEVRNMLTNPQVKAYLTDKYGKGYMSDLETIYKQNGGVNFNNSFNANRYERQSTKY